MLPLCSRCGGRAQVDAIFRLAPGKPVLGPKELRARTVPRGWVGGLRCYPELDPLLLKMQRDYAGVGEEALAGLD